MVTIDGEEGGEEDERAFERVKKASLLASASLKAKRMIDMLRSTKTSCSANETGQHRESKRIEKRQKTHSPSALSFRPSSPPPP
jgi:hypothetical protein